MKKPKQDPEQPTLFDLKKFEERKELRIKHKGGTFVMDEAVRRMLHGDKHEED